MKQPREIIQEQVAAAAAAEKARRRKHQARPEHIVHSIENGKIVTRRADGSIVEPHEMPEHSR